MKDELESLMIGTRSSYPVNKTVHQLFEKQAISTPNALAAVVKNQLIHYKELNLKANQLARYLLSKGVNNNISIAILMDRSIECLIAILAVMKAGAYYVPIDLNFPHKRVEYILTESKIKFILINGMLPKEINTQAAQIIEVNQSSIYQGESDNLDLAIDNKSLVYCMYTSGSTGNPKGVMVHHQALLNYVWWAKNFYVNETINNFALYSSLSFDLTVTSIFVPLVSGKTIHIYPDTSSKIPVINQVINDNKVDILKLTPAHLLVIKNLNLAQTKLKTLILGGENLKTGIALSINNKLHGNVKIYNEYGPTETVVGCMIYLFNPNKDLEATVPIGRPIDNARIYLLNEKLEPVGPTEIGEIYIAGDGVALGYNNAPTITAKNFVEDRFNPGLVMYASGDLGKIRNDGQMLCLGRKDSQIKLRGYRIELGEIENTLLKYPGLQQCVVDLHTEMSGEDKLKYCVKCGVASNFPHTYYSEDNICNHCVEFEKSLPVINAYFSTMDALQIKINEIKAKKHPKYDCIVSLSGGKDSTYVLCKLIDFGVRVLAFTLDNGFISDSAKANINHVVKKLGVEHRYLSTKYMNEIFVDSIRRNSDVCNGCFKTIYTLGINLAREVGVNYIFTGLSRGQLFETRLSELLGKTSFNEASFRRNIIQARKMYHRVDDTANRLLDNDWVNDDKVLEEIEFVDFYRYCHIKREELYSYIEQKVDWLKPPDTGRSTNCLLNDVAIYVHNKERGYHKYSLPYSWDVRMGHITRAEAMRELDDLNEIDVEQVNLRLKEIGYDIHASNKSVDVKQLVAYYQSEQEIPPANLSNFVSEFLPAYMIPSHFIRLTEIPLNSNGKINRNALPRLSTLKNNVSSSPESSMSNIEKKLTELWKEVLLTDTIGVEDDFFKIGGHSLSAIMLLFKIDQEFNKIISIEEFSNIPTIKGLAQLIEEPALCV